MGLGRSLAWIAGSTPAGAMDVSVVSTVCVVRWRSLRQADHSSRGVLPSAVCQCAIAKPRKQGEPSQLEAAHEENAPLTIQKKEARTALRVF